MYKQDLEKESRSLLSRMVLCAGVNVMAFLATGGYVLIQQKRIKANNLKEIDPQFYAAQVENLKLIAVAGFLIALIPALVCIYLVIRRTKVQQQLRKQEEVELEAMNVR